MPNEAKPEVIQMFAKKNRCWMCKHKFDKPVLLPVDKPSRGKFQPNINPIVLFHLHDTHGLDAGTVREWIIGTVYGMELTEMGMRK